MTDTNKQGGDKPTPVKIIETEKSIPVVIDADKPAPVKIMDTEKPIPVTIEDERKESRTVSKDDKQVLSPHTSEEDERVSLGQRNINLIWEHTQAQIAKATIYCNLGINVVAILLLILYKHEISKETIIIIMACLASLNGISGIVIGFYFSRTNHSAIGGVGRKDSPSSKGTR